MEFVGIRTTLAALGACIVIAMAGCGGSSGARRSEHATSTSGASGPTPSAPGSTAAGTSPTTAPAPGGAAAGLRWYIGIPVLLQLLHANQSLTTEIFDHPQTFVAITSPGQISQIPRGWTITAVETFFDGNALQKAVNAGQIPKGVKGIVLDDEKGNRGLTPAAEQNDPVPLEQAAAVVAHAHGLLFLDVGEAPAGSGRASRYHAAQYASVVDLQVQLSEDDLTKFDSAVQQGVAAFHQVNPRATVLVGITARLKTGQPATPNEMLQAVESTRSEAGGYWLNCTPCDGSDVATAVQFLSELSG